MRTNRILSVALIASCFALAMGVCAASAMAQTSWDAFAIRKSGGDNIGGTAPTINDVTVGGQPAKEFVITLGSQKAGWGTNDLNGKTVGDVLRLAICRHDDRTRFAPSNGAYHAPYFNIWVYNGDPSDPKYAVIANEPSDAVFQALYNGGYDLSWADIADKPCKVYENADKAWVEGLDVGGDGLTFGDVAGLQINIPPDPNASWAGLGTGAPRKLNPAYDGSNDQYLAVYGFNWVFGDTLSNYVSGDPGYIMSQPIVAGGPLTSGLIYDAIENPDPAGLPSLGYQATQTNEFGDHIVFGNTGRCLTTVRVGMISWAEISGDFTSGGATYTDPNLVMDATGWMQELTLNIYEVDHSGPQPAPGALIVSKTDTFHIDWAPGDGTHPFVPVTFNFIGEDVQLPDEVIYGLVFNTANYGPNPTGYIGPYNSLNFGLTQNTDFVPPVGFDADDDVIFWNTMTANWYTDGGAAGVGIFRYDDHWTPYYPAVEFSAVAAAQLTLDVPTAPDELYVQPGEYFDVDLNVSDLQSEVKACQAVLGFDSELLDVSMIDTVSGSPWNDLIYAIYSDPDAGQGDIDSAIGVYGDSQPGAGTDADGTIVRLEFQADPSVVTDTTNIVFRPDVDDVESTFLSDMNAQPVWPGKSDSQPIVIDGEAPTVDITAVTQEAGSRDLLAGSDAIQGLVTITVDADDAYTQLVGAPVVTITLSDASQETATLVGTSGTVYTYEWTVSSTTPNGSATILAEVEDMAGNTASDSVAINVNKNQIVGQVELQGFVGTGTVPAHTREVTFVATGAATATWTVELTNVSGAIFDFTLNDVPDGVTHLSAKTAWNLRSKVALSGGTDNQWGADLTGGDMLPAGDLNGTNTINILDYTLLKLHWYDSYDASDIDGSGQVQLNDYTLMKQNWYTAGDDE